MFFILIIFSALILLLSGINYRKMYLASKLPGPFPLPIAGNGWVFINKTSAGMCSVKMFRFIKKYFKFLFRATGNCYQNYEQVWRNRSRMVELRAPHFFVRCKSYRSEYFK